MKWITCLGCDEQRLVHHRASFCSTKCRNRVWRRRHGIAVGNGRRAFCAWCDSPLLYMPQDRLPAVRRYCHDKCARQAWLVARARKSMNSIKALDIAIRRLRKRRMPTVLAAGSSLADLLHDLVERQDDERAARIVAFQSRLPRVA
jgi:hypothetical protein